jgi:hypothetical protein
MLRKRLFQQASIAGLARRGSCYFPAAGDGGFSCYTDKNSIFLKGWA